MLVKIFNCVDTVNNLKICTDTFTDHALYDCCLSTCTTSYSTNTCTDSITHRVVLSSAL